MVYIEMLQAGHVGILQTYRAVNEQASRYIENYGVYRISLEDGQSG